MEAGRNPWLLNSNEALRGVYGCCCRQWCCVNPAWSQFLILTPTKTSGVGAGLQDVPANGVAHGRERRCFSHGRAPMPT